MAVVTLSRQLGSLGEEIGGAIAVTLGYPLVSRDVINRAAQLAGCPEVALAMIDDLGLLGMVIKEEEILQYVKAVSQVLMDLYKQGNIVIIGRGGHIVLRDLPGVLRVRVVAPLDVRIRRVADERNVSLRAAEEQIKASDKSREAFLKKFYASRADDPLAYDLTINTGQVVVADAVHMIASWVSRNS